jgi:hypothetical protein
MSIFKTCREKEYPSEDRKTTMEERILLRKVEIIYNK